MIKSAIFKKANLFLQGQDALKSEPGLSVSRNGTCLGGLCSLSYRVFFTLFILMQLYAWMYIPTIDMVITEDYIDLVDREAYEITLDHFLPMVGII